MASSVADGCITYEFKALWENPLGEVLYALGTHRMKASW